MGSYKIHNTRFFKPRTKDRFEKPQLFSFEDVGKCIPAFNQSVVRSIVIDHDGGRSARLAIESTLNVLGILSYPVCTIEPNLVLSGKKFPKLRLSDHWNILRLDLQLRHFRAYLFH